ncbi:carboxypeptidase B-like [Cimex lectularius]|uniref:Peptidase M14 domain-containing protein n=1 Tax=Cimex lectularius TaxID=79782 RepID=A0A8I6RHA8_CIMLE|nr:carboxypeptidase B-like [Cimex lectularius]XP_014243897.1 carboxypeptidase B-like [Cimex lectularius]XP_014243898.1 carboxypeptidase B-like [Cimex lectularius]XP_014243899.1 carboxypeptidase B-like [Cimex lectularius]
MNPAIVLFVCNLVITNSLTFNKRYQHYPIKFDDIQDVKIKRPAKLNLDTSYNTLETINEYVDYLARSRPDIVTKEVIGYSYQKSPITALHIHNDERATVEKPSILIDAGIHAREWISPAVGLCILSQLVENYEDNKYLIDKVNWYIVPMLNPDGYNYTWHGDRFWRKNRQKIPNSHCLGIDLNRNFGYKYGGIGTSKLPCEEIFGGNGPFSEYESRALRDYAAKLPNLRLYLTMHSYGNFLIFPWGWTYERPADYDDLYRVADRARNAMEKVWGHRYTIGTPGDTTGLGAGGSDDYMKAVLGVKYSYTFELPGGGEEGFDFPPGKIQDVCVETWEGIKAFAKFIKEENYRKRPRPKFGNRRHKSRRI